MAHDPESRRALMRQAACVAASFAASAGLVLPASGATRSHGRSLLVDENGDPFRAAALGPGEPMLFNYPFVSSPAFLLNLDRGIAPTELATKDGRGYASPAGVGVSKSIVAFSAICAHKLMYPTPQISFIGVRKAGKSGEPAHVIHCCGDDSRYDPAQGARVLAGPAPQPLAAVQLEWDPKADTLHAVGVHGAEQFDAFFEKYAFKLDMELGARAKAPTGSAVRVQAAAAYSRQWQRCPA
jgi:arsenite oxidase small subunit